MATELAKAYVQIVPSAEGIEKDLEDALSGGSESAGKQSGESFAKRLVKTIAGSAIIAKIGQGISATVNEGANYEQLKGGIETLYKDSADQMITYADLAYHTAGLSANDYMETVTSFSASLLKSLGGDTQAASKAANQAVIDMADNSNKMGTSMESIQMAYQGFAKQNYTMLDNLKLGYGGTKTEMERLLADAQEITGVEYDIDNLSDVYEAIHVIQGELGITGTTADEAATTVSGSAASMKAAFHNVLANLALGRSIGPSLRMLAQSVKTFLIGNLIPMIMNIIGTLPGALITFVEAMATELAPAGKQMLDSILQGLADMPALMSRASDMIAGLLDGITAALPGLLSAGVQILTEIGNGIFNAIPSFISMAGNIVTSLISTVQSAIPNILQAGWDIVSNLGTGLVNNLPAITDAIGQVLDNIGSTLTDEAAVSDMLAKGQEIMTNIKDGIANNIGTVGSAAYNIITTIISKITTYLPSILSMGGALLSNVVDGITTNLPSIASAAWDMLAAFMAKIFENLPTMIDEGNAILSNVVTGISEKLPDIASAAWDIISTITGKILEGLPGLIGWGFMILSKIGSGIVDNLPTIASAAWDMLTAIVTKIGENLPTMITEGASILGKIVEGLNNTIPDAVAAIWDMLGKIGAKIFESFPSFLAKGKTLVTKIANGIKENVGKAKSAIKEIIDGIGDKIKGMAETIKGWGKGIVDKIKIGIINAPIALAGFANKIYSAISSALANFSFVGLGTSIINGIRDGITGAVEGAVSAAQNAATSIYNGVRDFLHINSPSKLFRDGVGAPIGEGITVGIHENVDIDAAQRDINALLRVAQDTVHNPAVPNSAANTAAAVAAAVRAGMENATVRTTITEKSFRRGLQGMGVNFA